MPDKVKQETIFSAFNEPLSTAKLSQHLLAARTLSPVFNNHALIQVINMNLTSVKLYLGTKIGKVTPVPDIHLVENHDFKSPTVTRHKLPEIDLMGYTMSSAQQQKLLALLKNYADLFASEDDHLPCLRIMLTCLHLKMIPWDEHL